MSTQNKPAVSTRSVDDVLLALNWWGRYQKVQFVLCMASVLAVVMHSMSVVFIGRDAEHICATSPVKSHWYDNSDTLGSNITLSTWTNNNQSAQSGYSIDAASSQNETTTKYGKCKVRTYDSSGHQISSVDCPYGYQYTQPRDRTFVSEWDLVCDKEALSDFSQMIMSIGMTLGAVTFSFCSDRFGMKTVHILSHIFLFLLSITTAFSPNFAVFTVLRFFTGAAQQVCRSQHSKSRF